MTRSQATEEQREIEEQLVFSSSPSTSTCTGSTVIRKDSEEKKDDQKERHENLGSRLSKWRKSMRLGHRSKRIGDTVANALKRVTSKEYRLPKKSDKGKRSDVKSPDESTEQYGEPLTDTSKVDQVPEQSTAKNEGKLLLSENFKDQDTKKLRKNFASKESASKESLQMEQSDQETISEVDSMESVTVLQKNCRKPFPKQEILSIEENARKYDDYKRFGDFPLASDSTSPLRINDLKSRLKSYSPKLGHIWSKKQHLPDNMKKMNLINFKLKRGKSEEHELRRDYLKKQTYGLYAKGDKDTNLEVLNKEFYTSGPIVHEFEAQPIIDYQVDLPSCDEATIQSKGPIVRKLFPQPQHKDVTFTEKKAEKTAEFFYYHRAKSLERYFKDRGLLSYLSLSQNYPDGPNNYTWADLEGNQHTVFYAKVCPSSKT